jgi:3-oxoadipate enol-lactonase
MSEQEPRRTPDGRFTYLESGPAGAQPVLFLHGIGGGARLWVRQLESFGRTYRAIAWNMPGYGGSVPLEVASVGTYGDALADFIRGLSLDSPVLVGHSIGGMIVQSYLADGLGLPRAAVLAQTSPAFGGRDPEWARGFVAARLGPLDRGESMASLAPGTVSGMIGEDPDPAGVALAREVIAGTPAHLRPGSPRGAASVP